MQRILIVTALFCVTGVALAQTTPRVKPGAGGPRSDLVNDDAIRKLYADFTAAWNAHDAAKLASFYTIDGDTVEPDAENFPLALLGWLTGCVMIWSALFTVGNFLYGRMNYAFGLFAVFAVSAVILIRVVRRLWR